VFVKALPILLNMQCNSYSFSKSEISIELPLRVKHLMATRPNVLWTPKWTWDWGPQPIWPVVSSEMYWKSSIFSLRDCKKQEKRCHSARKLQSILTIRLYV